MWPDSRKLVLALVITLSGSLSVAPKTQEESAPKQTEPQYEDTFAGSVTECSSTKITVTRSILGQAPESRTFLIKPDTHVEGTLKAKVRVTVGFSTSEEGSVAKLIVVRKS